MFSYVYDQFLTQSPHSVSLLTRISPPPSALYVFNHSSCPPSPSQPFFTPFLLPRIRGICIKFRGKFRPWETAPFPYQPGRAPRREKAPAREPELESPEEARESPAARSEYQAQPGAAWRTKGGQRSAVRQAVPGREAATRPRTAPPEG